MKLYFSPPSPYARKVRVAVLELGLTDRVQEVETLVAPHKPNEAFGLKNPLMKVPALDTDEGLVLFNSPVICEYLDVKAGGNRLIPVHGEKRWKTLRRQALGDGILDAGILRRYELTARPENLRWPEWLKGQQLKIDFALDVAEREAGTWGKSFDIGDVAIACALEWLDFRFGYDDWRTRRPKLSAWLDQIAVRPSMLKTKPRA
jgi:glutathione S-transferase